MCDDEQWNSSIARDKKNVRYRWNFIDETICEKISFLKWTIEKKKKKIISKMNTYAFHRSIRLEESNVSNPIEFRIS